MNFLWWRRKQQERELDEEVRRHLEMAAKERVERAKTSEKPNEPRGANLGMWHW